MKYLNDYETDSIKEMPVILDERSGVPKFTKDALKARRCSMCNKVYFANYDPLDYECFVCRKYDPKEFLIRVI